MTKTLSELTKEAHAIAVEKGWWEGVPDIAPQFTNFHSEISEAWEEYRNGREMNEIYESEGGKPEGIPIELADCVIRIMDTCGEYGIDLQAAIERKMAYNRTRPYKHGGKRV